MDRGDARRAIIREWRKLPAEERRTEEQARLFVVTVKDKYPFEFSADVDRDIMEMIVEYQSLMTAPLREE
jgi:hypothetical protein